MADEVFTSFLFFAGSQAEETVKVFVLEQKQKTFTTKARRTRSFQCIEFKQLFFLRDLRAFVVNRFLN